MKQKVPLAVGILCIALLGVVLYQTFRISDLHVENQRLQMEILYKK